MDRPGQQRHCVFFRRVDGVFCGDIRAANPETSEGENNLNPAKTKGETSENRKDYKAAKGGKETKGETANETNKNTRIHPRSDISH